MKTQWPALIYQEAKETYVTMHLWSQIIGKIKLEKSPWINHSWHVTLFITPTGLTTLDIQDEGKHFQIELNFVEHFLEIKTSTREVHKFNLESNMSVAVFYEKIKDALADLNIKVKIHLTPNELENAIPFNKDFLHATYNFTHAENVHLAFLNANGILTKFRAKYGGKCSPVHFFWGGFDLAVSRFSGRTAPEHPGGVPHLPDWVAKEAYSHEVSSCGFWPGNELLPFAAFYSYIYPEPSGYKTAVIKPDQAYYHADLGEFILPYDAVKQSEDPESMVMEFLESTYKAAAELSKWEIS